MIILPIAFDLIFGLAPLLAFERAGCCAVGATVSAHRCEQLKMIDVCERCVCNNNSTPVGGTIAESLRMCISPLDAWYGRVNPDTGKRYVLFRPPKIAPFAKPDMFVPCGKCIGCAEDKRQEWCSRLQSELWTNNVATYITLTYNDDNLPLFELVNKDDIQRFIKRYRQIPRDRGIDIGDFKYFVSAEYGSQFLRPHYHGIIFGVDMMHDPRWQAYVATTNGKGYPVYSSPLLESVWSHGFVSIDVVTPSNIRYITKYIAKSMLGDNDDDMPPLFALHSRNIGRDWYFAVDTITDNGKHCYDLGYQMFRTANGFCKQRIPKFVDRLVDRYYPDDYTAIKARRKEFMAIHNASAEYVRNYAEKLKLRRKQEKQGETLNEYT